MKTRYKIIIIGIVLTIMVFGTHQYLMYQCGALPVFMETPRTPNLWNCLEIWENQSEQHPNVPLPINLSAERLSQVLRLCENTDAQYLGALSFENSTHHIDSQTCTWTQNQDKSVLNNLKCSSNALGGIRCLP